MSATATSSNFEPRLQIYGEAVDTKIALRTAVLAIHGYWYLNRPEDGTRPDISLELLTIIDTITGAEEAMDRVIKLALTKV